jgi:hypothetical protein
MLAALRTYSLFISAHALMTSLLVLATLTSCLTFDCHMDLFGWPTNHSFSALLLSIYQLSGSWHRSCCMLPQSSNTPEMIAPSQSSVHPWTTCPVVGRILFDKLFSGLTMAPMPSKLFTLQPLDKPQGTKPTIKWTLGERKYIIYYTHSLTSRKLQAVLEQHCRTVIGEIEREVSKLKAEIPHDSDVDPPNLGPSFHAVFPRTLNLNLHRTWASLAPTTLLDVKEFRIAIKHFVARFATADARRELINFLSRPHKTRDMDVHTLSERLQDLNYCVDLLPGTADPLDEAQLNTAYLDDCGLGNYPSVLPDNALSRRNTQSSWSISASWKKCRIPPRVTGMTKDAIVDATVATAMDAADATETTIIMEVAETDPTKNRATTTIITTVITTVAATTHSTLLGTACAHASLSRQTRTVGRHRSPQPDRPSKIFIAHIHHPEERWSRSLGEQFSQTQFNYHTQGLHITQNPRHPEETERLQIFHQT